MNRTSQTVIQLLSDYNADVAKLTVCEELSGQIASYLAGEVSQSASEDNK